MNYSTASKNVSNANNFSFLFNKNENSVINSSNNTIVRTAPEFSVSNNQQSSKISSSINVNQYLTQSIFNNASDPCAQVVHVLLCYHQGGEDPEFIRKAIESLVKKLKDRRMQLDSLISAVTSGGKQQTGCVTIHRSLDGRLQVAGRKGVPHVVYARIWRWPNVNKNELQKLPICNTPNDHIDLICINPFHYDRVVSGINNIDNSNTQMNLEKSNKLNNYETFSNCSYSKNVLECKSNSFQSVNSEKNELLLNSYKLEIENMIKHKNEKLPFLMFGPNQQPSFVVSHLASGSTISNRQLPIQSNIQANSSSQLQLICPISYNKKAFSDPENKACCWPEESSNTSNDFRTSLNTFCSFNSTSFPDHTNKYDQVYNTFGVQRYHNLRYNLHQVHIPYTPSPEHWCTILYYELDTQIGEAFKVPKDLTEIVVDGGMDPSGRRLGRYCLGALSNVHRTEASEKARIHIGKGIQLKTSEDGSIYLKCLSQKGVFVRSYFLDFEHSLIYGSTVHKFCSGAEKKLFDLRWAFAEMCEQRESAQLAVVAQAYAVAGIVQRVAPSLIERAGIGVDDLRRVCCTIAISFVKGWGSGYNRSSIKETPCWIEIHLHRPLQLLNFILQKTE